MILKHSEVTGIILNAFYKVYNKLGYGFLEKVYVRALFHELRKRGIKVEREVRIPVYYDGELIGEYFADLVVADKVIVEVKAVDKLAEEHEAQLLNYLKATVYEVGLLLNFGPKPEQIRRAYDNVTKGDMSWVSAEESLR